MSRKNGYVPMEVRIHNIAKVLDIQANEPSTETDPYMQGLYNGLELALATLENREPVFRTLTKRHSIKRLIDNFRMKFIRPKFTSEGYRNEDINAKK